VVSSSHEDRRSKIETRMRAIRDPPSAILVESRGAVQGCDQLLPRGDVPVRHVVVFVLVLLLFSGRRFGEDLLVQVLVLLFGEAPLPRGFRLLLGLDGFVRGDRRGGLGGLAAAAAAAAAFLARRRLFGAAIAGVRLGRGGPGPEGPGFLETGLRGGRLAL